MKIKSCIVAFCFIPISSSAFIFKSKTVSESIPGDGYVIDTLAENLRVPWQIAFLPDRTMLFTERDGRLRIYRNGIHS
ncbi:PQQ-dependent sugar dehydrogenase [Dyadobacter frigoris]|uniref:PQQ-dependent sugar dehydrogenase n=1 Tax=Dyadobacter frigoris TaxID=2576211 RepID=A0A4U6D0V6_9BACT|nr:PQQ-dependent sugar dehydrogenase [Dyadobacter frigoris]TKT90819.1 PQQ-dependent sugar dehydrogenase [Dyadobacter frigoris]